MNDGRRKGQDGEPVPRDMPDQQVGEGEDPWDAAPDTADGDVPDTDEAGTGSEGASRSANVHPEHPVADEPAD